MSEEKVQDSVQENLELEVESKPESADNGLLHEVMKYKTQRNEFRDKLTELETANEKIRQNKLAEDGKKDELIAELNSKVDHLSGEYTRLSKYEDDEKTNLIASIAADDKEVEELSKEKLSTLRLLKSKISSNNPDSPSARGSVGKKLLTDAEINAMTKDQKRERWSEITNYFKNKN